MRVRVRFVELSLSALMSTSFAFAGTPEQDPAVDLNRRAFSRAETPNANALRFDHRWVCGHYSTRAGSSSGTNGVNFGTFLFTSGSDGVRNRSDAFPGVGEFIPLRNSMHASFPARSGGAFHLYVRHLDGALIAELTGGPNALYPTPSAANPEESVYQYMYCTLFDQVSEAERVFGVRANSRKDRKEMGQR